MDVYNNSEKYPESILNLEVKKEKEKKRKTPLWNELLLAYSF